MNRVPPHTSGGPDLPAEELEQLEELGDDAIIAQQQGAHVPKPRAQVTEDARSIVISDHPASGSPAPSAPKIPAGSHGRKRSDRTEKTVVIRDRRQIEELRREMAKRKPVEAPRKPVEAPRKPFNALLLWPPKGPLLWVVVGVAAFLAGGLVALFATRGDEGAAGAIAPVVTANAPAPSAAPVPTTEPPSVSVDQLPIEGSKK